MIGHTRVSLALMDLCTKHPIYGPEAYLKALKGCIGDIREECHNAVRVLRPCWITYYPVNDAVALTYVDRRGLIAGAIAITELDVDIALQQRAEDGDNFVLPY